MKNIFTRLSSTIFVGVFCIIINDASIAQSISSKVLASSGNSFSNADIMVKYTVGEMATATLIAGSNIITQGFQQPDSCTGVPVSAKPSVLKQTLVSNVCGERIYRYTLTAVTNATGYAWNIPSAIGGVSGVTVDSGDITYSRIIRLKYVSNKAAISTDSIKVRAFNACTSSGFKGFKLTNAAINAPSTPASITITLVSNLCGARVYRYTAPTLPTATSTVAAATGYLWTLPFGPLGSNGVLDSGTLVSKVIRIRYSSNAAAGIGDSIRVRYNSICGYSLNKTVKISNAILNPPAVPTSITITKLDQLICNQPRFRYSAPGLPIATSSTGAATGYSWSFTGYLGAAKVIDSGSLTSGIFTVHFNSDSAAAIGDSIKLRYNSGCGYSSYKVVKLTNTKLGTNPPLAPASITMTLVSNVCGARVYRYTAPVLPAGTTTYAVANGYYWSLPFGPLGSTGVLDSGNRTSKTILVRYTSNVAAEVGDSIRVRYNSLCGYSPDKTAKLSNTALTGCKINIPIAKIAPASNTATEFSVMVYPNPTHGQINLQMKGLSSDMINIRVMDMQGRSIKTLQQRPQSTITILANDVPAGNYFVEVRQGMNVKVVKLVKQ